MIQLFFCSMSVAVISILTAVPNIYMLVQIYRNPNTSIGAGRMFTLIGVSNVACALLISIHKFMIVTTSSPILWFVATCSVASSLLQLGFNVSLAYERFQVFKHGLAYHTSDARRELERKLSICVVISSMIIGISSSTLRFTLGNVMFLAIPMATTRILGYIALCVIYVKLYVTIKSQNQAITAITTEQGQSSIISTRIVKLRQKRLKHAKMFFIGITSSFCISNLPIMIIFLTINKTLLQHKFATQ